MKTKDSVGPLINDNGDVIRESPCVASMLSKYFASVFFQQKMPIKQRIGRLVGMSVSGHSG